MYFLGNYLTYTCSNSKKIFREYFTQKKAKWKNISINFRVQPTSGRRGDDNDDGVDGLLKSALYKSVYKRGFIYDLVK